MIWIEDALEAGLSDIAIVDGHDGGSGEINIFLLTDDPKRAFDEAKRVLGSKDTLVGIRVAFRETSGETYIPLWPPELQDFRLK